MTLKLWMLLRAMELLNNVSNVKWVLLKEQQGLIYQLTQRLKIRGIITKDQKRALWENVQFMSFVGYKAEDGEILIVTSSHLTQEELESTMSTIIQQKPNFKKDGLL